MSEWEPATDAEVAMRDALRTDDQESYFRILSGVDLLLPVSADALAGLAPLGWGTWSTGGRTHVLAFTSTAALQACLADYTGSARRVPYAELANTWPNLEWWLAVNPGLPIEGYLPAWFVAQLSRGDLRLPTRGPGRESAPAASKIQDLQAAAIAANAAVADQEEAAARPGGPTHDSAPQAPVPAGYPQYPAGAPAAYGQAASSAPAYGRQEPGTYGQSVSAPPAAQGQGATSPAPYGQAATYGQSVSTPPASQSTYGQSVSAPPASQSTYGQSVSAPPAAYGRPASAPPAYGPSVSAPPAAYGRPASAATEYGQSVSAPPAAYGRPASAPSAYGPSVSAPPAYGPSVSVPPAYGQPASGHGPVSPAAPADQPKQEQVGPGGLPVRTPGAVLPSGLPARTPTAATPPPAAPAVVPPAYSPPAVPAPADTDPRGPLQDLKAPLPVRTPMAQTPPVPEHLAPQDPAEAPFDPAWSQPKSPAAPSELPRRTPAPSPAESAFPQGPASPQAAAAQQAPLAAAAQQAPLAAAAQQVPPVAPPAAESGLPQRVAQPATPQPAAQPLPGRPTEPSPGFGTPLPRRQAGSAAERSTTMSSFPAFQTRADTAARAEAPADTARPGLAPPVIPGSPGSDRPARLGQPPLEGRGAAVPAYSPQPAPVPEPVEEVFVPANDVERELFEAAGGGSTDAFLSTLLLATVLVPVADHSRPGSAPGESGFVFRTEQIDGEQFLIVFTSKDRLADHYAEPTRTVGVRFYELIRNWPDPAWSFAVNPTGPIGAKYPGPQVIALANWATEAGLGAEPDSPVADDLISPVPAPEPASDDAQHATVMQKTLPPEQVDYYLERGYDRVGGFVHRATEVEHLRTPAELFSALGLNYAGSPHQPDAKEAYVLRWPAYRPSLYRIPYGGQNEQALRAMDGWVIERAPFRGNGFAPGEGRDVIAEFKVDSVRLPHGSQLWRMDADGSERMVAIFDNDGPLWRRVGEH